VDLHNLLRREITEGMTEKQVASTVGVSRRVLTDILTGKPPQSRAVWEKFARYFRIDAEFLRTGESTTRSAAGRIRRIPLLNWQHMCRLNKRESLPDLIHAETMVEATDVAGARAFALKVQDDSMEPIFREGEMIFINPDAQRGPGDYVIAVHHSMGMATTILRQLNALGTQYMLHPLNWRYEDAWLAEGDVIVGKVVRLRKNL
jgi:SOS-response transcriptional repressor LexA